MTASGANSRNSRSSVSLRRSGITPRIDQRHSVAQTKIALAPRIPRPAGGYSVVMDARRWTAAASIAAAAICVAIAGGCGGGSDSETVAVQSSPSGAPESPATEQPLSAAEQHGRDLFV